VIWLLVLVQLIGLPLLLALLYPVAIKYERGPKDRWRYLLYVSAGVLSFYLNWTTLALLFWDWPRHGEWTFSMRLERLVWRNDWRGRRARVIAAYLNRHDPSPPHVPIPDFYA
jgi:hypothetical protein